ncbi:MAG: thioredoxin domain-containing protein [Acidobacteriia bacterium]|nr:thioredoxin domain-containing protein [Terriglobia bacterium]
MYTNRLANEKSPYLLQHAHNPVDWYPWGEEAFARARAEDKPIFLSIGYSTCHWCHVMERESFENEKTAEILNRDFICIKVDREERPDIDRIYMNYVQAATGSGGWPMSVWLTPALKPFVGGTYFPPDNRYGKAGFPLILQRIMEVWRDERTKILESSATVLDQLKQGQEPGSATTAGSTTTAIDAAMLDKAYLQQRRSFDSRLGGFGGAPKFPRPSVHNFLLRYWKRTGNADALDMVTTTLIGMSRGGMNDQLGGGFHRYSVDEFWFVPHFEKMLYDEAQLAVSYLEAFQITGNDAFEAAARRTLDYVIRDMTSPEGAFWSAEDADSAPDAANPAEKSEGAFYIWSWQEIADILGPEHAAWFSYRYGMEREGNVQNDPHHEFTGRNILFAARTITETAEHFSKPLGEVAPALAAADAKVLAARAARPRPHLDDKSLTSWNGLMISAFARAAAILQDNRYQTAAVQAADFLLSTMLQPDGTLLRRYRAGDAAIGGMLDDYVNLAGSLIDLYEATFDPRFLENAIALMRTTIATFGDPENGGFFASSHEDVAALVKLKDDYDGAEPSGNSVALMNLLRLARITGDAQFDTEARRLIASFAGRAASSPHGIPQFLAAIEFDLAQKREIVVAGSPGPEITQELWKRFEPFRVLMQASPEIAAFRPEIADMTAPPEGARVYVCVNFACQTPVTTAEALAQLLN